jgi:hypothetical protein
VWLQVFPRKLTSKSFAIFSKFWHSRTPRQPPHNMGPYPGAGFFTRGKIYPLQCIIWDSPCPICIYGRLTFANGQIPFAMECGSSNSNDLIDFRYITNVNIALNIIDKITLKRSQTRRPPASQIRINVLRSRWPEVD